MKTSKIIKLYSNGESIRNIASVANCSTGKIRRILMLEDMLIPESFYILDKNKDILEKILKDHKKKRIKTSKLAKIFNITVDDIGTYLIARGYRESNATKITKKMEAKITDLYKKKESITTISKKIKLSKHQVYKILKSNGIYKNNMKLTEDKKNNILLAIRNGKSQKQICREFKISRSTIYNLKKFSQCN